VPRYRAAGATTWSPGLRKASNTVAKALMPELVTRARSAFSRAATTASTSLKLGLPHRV
jgi:hypothetical protein